MSILNPSIPPSCKKGFLGVRTSRKALPIHLASCSVSEHCCEKKILLKNAISTYSRRKKEEGRRKKEEGRRKKEEAVIAMVLAIKKVLTVLAVAIIPPIPKVLPTMRSLSFLF